MTSTAASRVKAQLSGSQTIFTYLYRMVQAAWSRPAILHQASRSLPIRGSSVPRPYSPAELGTRDQPLEFGSRASVVRSAEPCDRPPSPCRARALFSPVSRSEECVRPRGAFFFLLRLCFLPVFCRGSRPLFVGRSSWCSPAQSLWTSCGSDSGAITGRSDAIDHLEMFIVEVTRHVTKILDASGRFHLSYNISLVDDIVTSRDHQVVVPRSFTYNNTLAARKLGAR